MFISLDSFIIIINFGIRFKCVYVYSGGAELLFDKIKEHKVTLDSKENCKSSTILLFLNKEPVSLIILIYHFFFIRVYEKIAVLDEGQSVKRKTRYFKKTILKSYCSEFHCVTFVCSIFQSCSCKKKLCKLLHFILCSNFFVEP